MKSTNTLIAIGAVFICSSVLLFTCGPEMVLLHRMSDLQEKGTYGDAFGGSLGPLVGLLGAAITFLAFWVQYQANEVQKRALRDQEKNLQKQEKDLARERFENRFYKQIDILKGNLDEVSIGKSTTGRKAFISFFNELKFLYYVVDNHYRKRYLPTFGVELSDEAVYNVAYLIFFFGIGPNSKILVRSFLTDDLLHLFENAATAIEKNQTLWRTESKKGQPIAVSAKENVFTLDINYLPGNGHVSKLSHYIRHLFQTLKFVHEMDEEIISPDLKYEYITVLRSQLSPHEQLFIYYNALSVLGKPWLDKPNFIRKYCLIKSTLLPLADFYRTPVEMLGTINEENRPLFEWIEISKRLQTL
jgi:hypothetical protein